MSATIQQPTFAENARVFCKQDGSAGHFLQFVSQEVVRVLFDGESESVTMHISELELAPQDPVVSDVSGVSERSVSKSRFVDPVPSFPAELKDLDRWLVYGKGKKFSANGDPDKTPYDARTGQKANSKENRTDFQTCVGSMSDYHGLGFAPEIEDKISMVDFDDCVDPATKAIKPIVADVIRETNSYAEFSPTGTGVHIFVSGWVIPDERGVTNVGAEVYSKGRYFTVTGNQVPGTPNKAEIRDLTGLWARIRAGAFSLDEGAKAQSSEFSKDKLMDTNTPIPLGMHDVTLTAIAGKLREDGLEYDEMLPIVLRHCETRCVGRGSDWVQMCEKICKSVCRYPAGDPTPTVLKGGQLPGEAPIPQKQSQTQVEVIDEVSIAEMKAPAKRAVQTLKYPHHVWQGTLYGEFAELCGAKNKVAHEFFSESIKTVVGAICGHRLQTRESKGQQPARFYTILIGPGGGGKSSAQKWATDMFSGTGYLPEISQGQAYVNIGAMKGCYSSASGLVEKGYSKSSRLFQIYDEATVLIEKFGIHGSGDSYLDQINGMFEAGYVPQSLTKTSKMSDVVRPPADHSILGCTTETKWKNAFRNTSTEKSGFFQRLNIVTNDSEDRVADFNPPDLSALREKFIQKIAPLEFQTVEVEMLPEAIEAMEKWFESKQSSWKAVSTDVTGRLQVLIKRNAAHIAWLLNGDDGTLDPENPNTPIAAVCNADVMQRAIALAEYQERARLIHQPIIAENDYALMEGLIEQHFHKTNYAPVPRTKLRRVIHAERFGTRKFDEVIRNLELEGLIQVKGLPNEERRGRKTQVIVWLGDEE